MRNSTARRYMSSPDSVQSSSSSQSEVERLFEADVNSLFQRIVVEPLMQRATDYVQSLFPSVEELLMDRSRDVDPWDAMRPEE